MIPTQGRIVLYRFPASEEAPNGTEVVPAVIVQVWSDDCVNLRLFTDGPPGGHEWVTSVVQCPLTGSGEVSQPGCWAWPLVGR